jgi:hypothetical protein
MRKFAAFLIALSFSSVMYAQKKDPPHWGSANMEVAGSKLHLGMTKAEVTERLAGSPFKKIDENFWVMGTEKHDGPALQFTNGRLAFVSRNWVTYDNDITEALFGAVTSLNGEGFSACKVTADTKTDPTVTSQRVWIDCGEKTILIVRSTFVGGNTYCTVDEHLGAIH